MPVLNANEIMFTAFEPKVQNRFIMYIAGVPAYLIKKVTAPNFEAGEVILDHIKGAYVKTATFGDYDWSQDSYISLSATIAMDYCILNY